MSLRGLYITLKGASYTSSTIHNELIHLEISGSILDGIWSAKWFSLMADECTNISTYVQMSIYFCFVGESSLDWSQVKEEFIDFVKLDGTDAKRISEAILKFLDNRI